MKASRARYDRLRRRLREVGRRYMLAATPARRDALKKRLLALNRKFRALSAVILPPDPRLRLGPPLTTPSKRVRRGRRPFGYSEFKPEGRPMKITPEIRAEVDRLRRDRHLSDRSIARLFGISPTTIGTIPRRPR